MNKLIPKIGAAIVTLTVFLFAIFMIVDFPFGSYFVCMFLPIGHIMMAAGFHHESAKEQRVSANIGMIFSAIYMITIMVILVSMAIAIYFGDWIKEVLPINLLFLLLFVQKQGMAVDYEHFK